MTTMNGSGTGTALAMILCALFLHAGVHCDDTTSGTVEATNVPPADASNTQADSFTGPALTNVTGSGLPSEGPTVTTQGLPSDSTTVTTQGPKSTSVTKHLEENKIATTADPPDGDNAGTTAPGLNLSMGFTDIYMKIFGSVTIAGPVATQNSEATDTRVNIKHSSQTDVGNPPASLVKPTVECVNNEAIKHKDAVNVKLDSKSSCSNTKKMFEELAWCNGDCRLQVFQEENSDTLLLNRVNGPVEGLAGSLNQENIKKKLGVVEATVVEATPQAGKNPPTVLVSLLIIGLLVAAALIGCYFLKNRRGDNAKGMRLAEETYQVDEENQGNTLVSVAPLNPPETPEKPANGDSQEAVKAQPPPTNGHSTPKTADTEL